MAKGKAKKKAPAKRAPLDAVSFLKGDHRQVEEWFEAFENSNGDAKKRDLASRICKALTVHTKIEEEIFYPAFLKATGDKDTHHEAEIEHAGAKNLIAQIEKSGPDDDYYDSKVKVLSEMIKHHVNEPAFKHSGSRCSTRQTRRCSAACNRLFNRYGFGRLTPRSSPQ